MRQGRRFYGYKHWTLEETPRCFYVGKGLINRPHSRYRNKKWHAVVERLGLRVEICVGPVTDEEACAWEIDQIAHENTFTTCFRHHADDINCNFTRGGEGTAGRVYAHREDTKQKIREARAKQVIPAESQKRGAEKRKGKPRSDTIWNKGLKLTEDQVKNFGVKQRGQKRSDETRAHISAAITAWHAKRKQQTELLRDVL